MKTIIKSFITFLIKPNNKKDNNIPFVNYVIILFVVLIVGTTIKICISMLLSLLNISMIQSELPLLQNMSLLKYFIFGVVCAPIFEELCYRYPLKFSKNSLLICILSWAIIRIFINQSVVNNYPFFAMPDNKILIILFFILLFVFVVTRLEFTNIILIKFWHEYSIIIIYIFAIYFAFVHFTLPLRGINWFWLPIFVFPQFVMALYFSYIRLKVKFIYSIFLHMITNFIAFLGIAVGFILQ